MTDIVGKPANIYLFKVNTKNIRKRCEICSKSIIKSPKRGHSRRSDVFLVYQLLILSIYLFAGKYHPKKGKSCVRQSDGFHGID